MMSAQDAFVVNHLCPLMTQLVAVEHRRRGDDGGVGPGEERLGQREGAGDFAAQIREQPPLLLCFVGTVGEQLHIAAVGGLHTEQFHRHHASTDDLRHQGQPELARARTAEAGVEEHPPQALRLDPLLQMTFDRLPLVGRQLAENRFQRNHFTVDELAHPRQLFGEFGVGLEIPRHGHPSAESRSQCNHGVIVERNTRGGPTDESLAG